MTASTWSPRLGRGPQQPGDGGQARSAPGTGPTDDGEIAGRPDGRPRVVVAVGEGLGQAFRVVGLLDLVTEPVERLDPADHGVLDAHQEAHRRREILLGRPDEEAAVVLLRSAVPADAPLAAGRVCSRPSRLASSSTPPVTNAANSIGRSSALDELGHDDAGASSTDTGSSCAIRSAGNSCAARNRRISASPSTRPTPSAGEEKTRAIQAEPSSRLTISVHG